MPPASDARIGDDINRAQTGAFRRDMGELLRFFPDFLPRATDWVAWTEWHRDGDLLEGVIGMVGHKSDYEITVELSRAFAHEEVRPHLRATTAFGDLRLAYPSHTRLPADHTAFLEGFKVEWVEANLEQQFSSAVFPPPMIVVSARSSASEQAVPAGEPRLLPSRTHNSDLSCLVSEVVYEHFLQIPSVKRWPSHYGFCIGTAMARLSAQELEIRHHFSHGSSEAFRLRLGDDGVDSAKWYVAEPTSSWIPSVCS